MAIWSALFGSSETTNKIVDGVSDGLDAMFFTDEEKSVANQKILDFKLKYAAATQGQNIARRLIAIGVTAMWMLVGIICLVAEYFERAAFSDFAFKFLTDVVMQPFSIIIGFYFLAHIVAKSRA